MKHLLLAMVAVGTLGVLGCQNQPAQTPPKDAPIATETRGPDEVISTPAAEPPGTHKTRTDDLDDGTVKRTTVTPTTPPPPVSNDKTYVVQKGDTLFSIAKKIYGDPKRVQDIATLNDITDVSKLRVGQTLKLPPK
jgi:nucleoid-associated protein YgaU